MLEPAVAREAGGVEVVAPVPVEPAGAADVDLRRFLSGRELCSGLTPLLLFVRQPGGVHLCRAGDVLDALGRPPRLSAGAALLARQGCSRALRHAADANRGRPRRERQIRTEATLLASESPFALKPATLKYHWPLASCAVE